MKTLLALLIVAAISLDIQRPTGGAAEGEAGCVALEDLPEFTPDEFKADPYIAAAIKLQTAGKVKAKRLLLSLAKDPDHGEKVIILCRMLFTASPNSEFRRPLLGTAMFLAKTEFADWPLEPIEIVDGVPFLVVLGCSLEGKAERAVAYVEYCIRDCAWQEVKFRPRNRAEKEKDLESLVASPKWTAHVNSYLASQIK